MLPAGPRSCSGRAGAAWQCKNYPSFWTNFSPTQITPYLGRTNWPILEWLRIGGLQCLEWLGRLVRSRQRERIEGWGHNNVAIPLQFQYLKTEPFIWQDFKCKDQTMDGRHSSQGKGWASQGQWFRIWRGSSFRILSSLSSACTFFITWLLPLSTLE